MSSQQAPTAGGTELGGMSDTTLLAALQELVIQLKRPAVPAEDELWTSEDVAAYVKLSVDTVERRVVVRPDFPTPLQPCATGPRATRRWFAGEVRLWARQNRSKLPKPRSARKPA